MLLLHDTTRKKDKERAGWDGPHCPSARNRGFYFDSFKVTQWDHARIVDFHPQIALCDYRLRETTLYQLHLDHFVFSS